MPEPTTLGRHDEPQHSGAVAIEFLDLYGDSLLAEILARDTACGPDYRMLNADQLDRRILLQKLADAYRELDQALAEGEV